MSAGKVLLYGGLGVAAALLLTTDKAKELRIGLQERAMSKLKESLPK